MARCKVRSETQSSFGRVALKSRSTRSIGRAPLESGFVVLNRRPRDRALEAHFTHQTGHRPLPGCRRTQRSVGAAPLFSFHLPLGSAGFHRFHRYYEEIRLLLGHGVVVVASFKHFHFRGPEKISLGKDEWLPAAPVLNTVMSRLDIGRRVDEHVRPDTPALQGFAFARCCGFSSASIPHALTGKVGSGSRRFRPHAVAYDLWLPPAGSIRDLHPPPFIHARRTQSPYGLLPIPPRSLSLPTYSCVDPPPPSTLISRGEVSHRGWHRGL